MDGHRKFPVIKQVEGFSEDNIIKTWRIRFFEYGLPSKEVSDVGINFISEKFENICRKLGVDHLYHHHTAINAVDKQKLA